MPDLGALMRAGRADLAPRRYPLATELSKDFERIPWQYDSGSPAWAARRTRSGASSSPTSAPRATAASSRSSGSTTRRPSPSTITLDEERVRDWLAKGAQPTDQVRKLLRIQGIDPDAR